MTAEWFDAELKRRKIPLVRFAEVSGYCIHQVAKWRNGNLVPDFAQCVDIHMTFERLSK